LISVLLFVSTTLLLAQKTPPVKKSSSRSGEKIFASSCSGCHGLDGHGGERAPNIASSAKVQRMSDEQIFQVITEGIAGTGMPAFHSLSEADRRAVIKHLRMLEGQTRSGALPGNPAAGKSTFFGKGECSTCHMVAGTGGFLGSDLTVYAQAKSAQQVREAIVDPASNPNPRSKRVIATTHDGRQFTGVVRNQDNFSVQLQATDGAFHFFRKSDLATLDYDPRPLMPSDYGHRLSRRDLDDLVSYLISVARTRKAAPVPRNED
jgi:cytochrome c oxidase cbb3-type subunit III